MMKILSPIDRFEEVGLLIDAGADELYGGVVPDSWTHGGVGPNQRTFANAQFSSEDSFAKAVTEAAARGVKFHLTLNAPLYPPTAYDELIELASRAATWGLSSLIVGDLGLILRLKDVGLPLEITLSTMAGALNTHSLDLFRRLGVGRVVLPRHLTLKEMGEMVAYAPELEFEAFVLVGKCPNEESYCTFQHTSPQKRWPCEIPYRLYDEGGKELDKDHPFVHWNEGWNEADRRKGCGICAIGRLAEIGVKIVKLVGRGGPTKGKVANIKLVKGFVDSPERSDGKQAYLERFGCECSPHACYFPELWE